MFDEPPKEEDCVIARVLFRKPVRFDSFRVVFRFVVDVRRCHCRRPKLAIIFHYRCIVSLRSRDATWKPQEQMYSPPIRLRRWSFGDDEAQLGDYAWFSENSEKKT